LRDNPEMMREIETSIRQNAGLLAEKLQNGGPDANDTDGE
jgi:recombination protein RecA